MKTFKAIIYCIAIIFWVTSLITLVIPGFIFYLSSLVLEEKI